MRMLKNLLRERRENPRKQQIDFFDYVLEELKKEGTILTEAIALDLMFVLLFASFETTSLAITLAVKLLSDHPSVAGRAREDFTESRKCRHSRMGGYGVSPSCALESS